MARAARRRCCRPRHGASPQPRESPVLSRILLALFLLCASSRTAWPQESIFAPSPAPIGHTENTASVALGDVDGDGEDGRTLSAGVYALRLVAPERSEVRKLVKIR